eukprot:scaffold32765_cov22-Tisochrysis_lutea.AAC.4
MGRLLPDDAGPIPVDVPTAGCLDPDCGWHLIRAARHQRGARKLASSRGLQLGRGLAHLANTLASVMSAPHALDRSGRLLLLRF